MFEADDFLAELTQHIPPKGVQLIRRYGLYSSRIKGNWEKYAEVAERAPPGWKKQHGMTVQVYDAENPDIIPSDTDSVEVSAFKKAWARMQGRAVTRRVTTRHDYFQGCTKSIRLLAPFVDLK